jgi:hypothetical protein
LIADLQSNDARLYPGFALFALLSPQLAARCSLLSPLCSLLSALCSLLSALCSLLSTHCSLLPSLYVQPLLHILTI